MYKSTNRNQETLKKTFDNIIYNKIKIAGNITTEISDFLIQFLREPSAFLKHNQKAIPHIALLSILAKKTLRMRYPILLDYWEKLLDLKENDVDYSMDYFLHDLIKKCRSTHLLRLNLINCLI